VEHDAATDPAHDRHVVVSVAADLEERDQGPATPELTVHGGDVAGKGERRPAEIGGRGPEGADPGAVRREQGGEPLRTGLLIPPVAERHGDGRTAAQGLVCGM